MSPVNALRLLLLLPWIALGATPAPGSDAPQDPEFAEIVGAVTRTNHDASCDRMLRWVDAHPRHPDAGRGLIWMSKLRRADGREDLARPLLERARRDFPGTEWELNAVQGLADLDLAAHRYGDAIAGYEALAQSPSPLWSYIGQHAAQSARDERLRFGLLLGAVAALVALALYRLARSGGPGTLWPPPAELVYPLPILLLLLVATLGQEPDEAHAIATVALGAVALLWLNGAYLRARPPRGTGRVVIAAMGVLQAGALLYCALVANGLWAKLQDTLAMGAE